MSVLHIICCHLFRVVIAREGCVSRVSFNVCMRSYRFVAVVCTVLCGVYSTSGPDTLACLGYGAVLFADVFVDLVRLPRSFRLRTLID